MMPSATVDSTASRVPAWKRLGLKLKAAQPELQHATEHLPDTASPKRKREKSLENESLKKAKKSNDPLSTDTSSIPQLTRKKSVTFTSETKIEDGDSVKQLFNSWAAEQKAADPSFQLSSNKAFATPESPNIEEQVDTTLPEKERRVKRVKKPEQSREKLNVSKADKKSKIVKSKPVQTTKPKSAPFLAYLKTYYEDRPNWKFNKAHQNHLLRHIFDVDVIPSEYVHQIYVYVRGLQGGVRTRLRDEALKVKVMDQESPSMDGWTEEAKRNWFKEQEDYKRSCSDYVANMTVLNSTTRMGYEEGILAGISDFGMKKRVARRTRAEQIMQELSDGKKQEESKELEQEGPRKRKRKQRTRSLLTANDSSSDEEESDSSSSASEEEKTRPAKKIQKSRVESSSSSSSGDASSSSDDTSDSDAADATSSSGEDDSDDSDESD
ncbi:hypothetical protein B0O99DRAFT_676675 [Bisporella sp. PMI_857]|nr:hypothetical protein B0O99DRAFT_676675 [Bisporella sp. PMI_857]